MRTRILTWLGLLTAIVVMPLPAWSQLTAGMTASRTSGTAPLYVFFDATADAGLSHSDPDVVEFRDLLCEWDFGDAAAGTWSNSGLPQNEASGCIAAHVYESPGSYDATMRVSDEAGNQSSFTRTITVISPDVTWSGTNTVCFENGGGFAGCPAGAQQVSTGDYDSALANQCGVHRTNAVKRCLFRRGDRFILNASTQMWDGPILIGAFGPDSDPRPIIDGSGWIDDTIHVLGHHSPAQRGADIRFDGLEYIGANGIQGAAHAVARCGSEAPGGVEDILFLDLTLRSLGGIMGCADSGNPVSVPDKIAFVSNVVHAADHRSIGFISATRVALLNNTSTEGGFRSSHIRFSFGRKIIIQHNQLTGQTGNSSIKIAGMAAVALGNQVPDLNQQRYWLISDNRMDCDGGNCIGGYNNASQRGVAHLDRAVIERNDFRIAEGTSSRVLDSCFAVAAIRNNVSRAGSESSNPIFDMHDAGGDCLYPRNQLRIYNNTFYGTGSRPRHAIRFMSGNEDSIVRNNLYYTPGSTRSDRVFTDLGGSRNIVTDNLQTNQDLFANTGAFDTAMDFRIDTNSSGSSLAVDSGFDLRSASNDGEVIFVDYMGQCLTNSSLSSRRDLGAFETGAVECEDVGDGGTAPAPEPPPAPVPPEPPVLEQQ